MSSLSKSILCLGVYPLSARKALEQAIKNTHPMYQEFVTTFTVNKEYVGFYVFVYLEDHHNVFVENTKNIITRLQKEGYNPIVLRAMEKEGFTRHNWVPMLHENNLLKEKEKEKQVPYQFVFIQIAFVTKAWLSLIREEIRKYAENTPNMFPLKKWNNYLSSVLFLIPNDQSCKEVTQQHITRIVKNIIEASQHVKLERPNKRVPEILYQDISTTIVSSLIHSTTQGVAITGDDIIPFSLHLDDDKVILRPVSDKQC